MVSRDPEVEVANLDALAALRRALVRQRVPPNPVDDAYYAAFVEQSDEQLDELARMLLLTWAGAFNDIGDAGWTDGGERFVRFLDAVLYMTARGFILFDEDWTAMCYPPDGPPPSEAAERAIAARIRSLHEPERLQRILDDVVRGN
jgi:hypothetical protein